jgi:hypothetical protein
MRMEFHGAIIAPKKACRRPEEVEKRGERCSSLRQKCRSGIGQSAFIT